MKFSERLCAYRKKVGMSQQELAEFLNVSRQSVSKWETDVAMPTIDNLQRLGELYGVSIDTLINGTNSADTVQNHVEHIECEQQLVRQRKWAVPYLVFSCILMTFFLIVIQFFCGSFLSRETGHEEVWVQPVNVIDGVEDKFLDISDLQKVDDSGRVNIIGVQ